MTKNKIIRGLYVLLDTAVIADKDLTDTAEQVLRGGASVVQYRDKKTNPTQRLRDCEQLAELCAHHHRIFIVNDNPELAARCRADGVHLGQDDPDINHARRLLGPNAIVGISCYNQINRALTAQAAGATYVAFGSFFPSRSKPYAVRVDPQLLPTARKQLRIPIVAIGGITTDNGAALIAQGANALAVIDGVLNQNNIPAACRALTALFGPAITCNEST